MSVLRRVERSTVHDYHLPMTSAHDAERAARPSGLSRRARLIVAALAVIGGVPFVLFVWIGAVVLVGAGGVPLSAAQVLAWLLSAIVGVVVWPLALRRARHEFERRQSSRAVPTPTPTRADAVARAILVVLGAVAIIALTGPRDIISALADAGATISIGPRENGLLVQLVATILIVIIAAPALILTQRALGRMRADDPRRPRLEERQNWHLAAAVAWVCSLGVGLLVSLAALITM